MTSAAPTSESVVFIGGHWLGHCAREYGEPSCECDDDYVAIFNRCPVCGETLDRWGDCPDGEDEYHYAA